VSIIGSDGILSDGRSIAGWNIESNSCLSIPSCGLDIGWNIRNKGGYNSVAVTGSGTGTNRIGSSDGEGVAGSVGKTCDRNS